MGETTNAETTNAETHAFQAEVGKLLDIVANSLYSEKEIFLRELISNAADACDRLRHAALTTPDLIKDDPEFRIRLTVDKPKSTLTISDNGVGMDHDALVQDLGTIARSGTAAFVEQLSAAAEGPGKDRGKAAKPDVSLIGQFGVGFYAAFMVADRVEVTSRKAAADTVWRWVSDGRGSFTVDPAEARLSGESGRGTDVRLRLRKGDKAYLEPQRLRTIVKTYSDHVAQPIYLRGTGIAEAEQAQPVNTATALWTRPKSEITEDQYKEFFHDTAHGFGDPWMTLHVKAEGRMEYAALLFIPDRRPFDLFTPERRSQIKLYVRRVFITDDCKDLLPGYLRFVRGVVDSEDLSLNIGRELLQEDPMVARIRGALVKRVISELRKKADKDPEAFTQFWTDFGAVLKEGIYEDTDQRDTLLDLCRFHGTAGERLVSLGDYVGRMRDGQTGIFYIAGDDVAVLRQSPQLEGYRARGVEVLLMTDPVDEFWLGAVGTYKDKPFQSVTRGEADLASIPVTDESEDKKSAETPDDTSLEVLVQQLKRALEDKVKDVRLSQRLTDSPVCLVADEAGLDMHLERLLKQHQRLESTSARVLEINGTHPLIRGLANLAAEAESKPEAGFDDAARLLLDQACIVEGEPLLDPAGFARRMTAFMERGLAG